MLQRCSSKRSAEKRRRAYGIRWLVLGRADSVDAVAPILDGDLLPPWLGEPVLTEGDPTRLAIYPVVAGS